MFVYYFTHLSAPYETLEPIFAGGAELWVPEQVSRAFEAGEELMAKVGIGKRARWTKSVSVSLGSPRRTSEGVVLPLDVRADPAEGLFPRLEGDLELARLGPQLSQLTMRGSYRPPLGGVGEIIDRALLHRVAESAVKDFMEQLSLRLVETVRAGVDLAGSAPHPPIAR